MNPLNPRIIFDLDDWQHSSTCVCLFWLLRQNMDLPHKHADQQSWCFCSIHQGSMANLPLNIVASWPGLLLTVVFSRYMGPCEDAPFSHRLFFEKAKGKKPVLKMACKCGLRLSLPSSHTLPLVEHTTHSETHPPISWLSCVARCSLLWTAATHPTTF